MPPICHCQRDDDDDDYDAPPKRAFESDEDDEPYADDDDDKPARKSAGKPLKASQSKELESAGTDDYRGVVLPRSRLARLCPAPWFESWVVDGYVRYLVGQNQGENQYRICRVKAVEDVPDKVYRFENASTSKRIVIEHGKLEKTVTMEGVSDSPPTDREINRLKAQLVTDNIDQLTVKEAAKLKERLDERTDYIMTEVSTSLGPYSTSNYLADLFLTTPGRPLCPPRQEQEPCDQPGRVQGQAGRRARLRAPDWQRRAPRHRRGQAGRAREARKGRERGAGQDAQAQRAQPAAERG